MSRPTAPADASRLQRMQVRVWRATTLFWLLWLAYPVLALASEPRPVALTVVGAVLLVLFVVTYVRLMLLDPFRHCARGGRAAPSFVLLTVIALVTPLLVSDGFLGLGIYVSTATGIWVRPARRAVWCVVALTVAVALVGTAAGAFWPLTAGMTVLTLAVGPSVLVSARLMEVVQELDDARAEIAGLAVERERLRFARDLHDLLGHSLSLIALKSELAGRLLPGQPERAAREVAELEGVARAALAEVREAVGGYRAPTLAAELRQASTMLRAAGIAADVDGVPAGLPAPADAVLAWGVREAVTNVVRHAGAARCRIRLAAGADATLEVTDDGGGPAAAAPRGAGLTGLDERAREAGGVLETGAGPDGFRLRLRVPQRGADAARPPADVAVGG